MNTERVVARLIAKDFIRYQRGEDVNTADLANRVMAQIQKRRIGNIIEIVNRHIVSALFADIGDWTLPELELMLRVKMEDPYPEWSVFSLRPIELRGWYAKYLSYDMLLDVIEDLRRQYQSLLAEKNTLKDDDCVLFCEEVPGEKSKKILPPRTLRPHLVEVSMPTERSWILDDKLKYPAINGGDDHLRVVCTIMHGSLFVELIQDGRVVLTCVGHGDGVAYRTADHVEEEGVSVHGLPGTWLLLERKPLAADMDYTI